MLTQLFTTIILSSDSFLATLFLAPFIKNRWNFVFMLGLFDGLAYLLGMAFPISGFAIPAALVVLCAVALYFLFKRNLVIGVALALSADNLVEGFTRSSYLTHHGLLAKCFLSGTVFAHALMYGVASFIAAGIGLGLVILWSKTYSSLSRKVG